MDYVIFLLLAYLAGYKAGSLVTTWILGSKRLRRRRTERGTEGLNQDGVSGHGFAGSRDAPLT